MSMDVGLTRMTTLLTFDTTHHALWAEQIVAEHRLGAQVVPSPAEANAKCDLAIECLDEDLNELRRALEAAGVPFRIFVRNRGVAGEA
jgi:hypothetical protein